MSGSMRKAALTRGARRAFRQSRGSYPAPRHTPPAAVRQLHAGACRSKNSGQLSVFFLLPPPLRAECDTVRRGTVNRGLWVRRLDLAGLMAARIAGCDPIIAFDPLPSQLVLARELGARHEDLRRDFRQLVMDEV